jgi:hypothetical protein
MKTNPLTVLTAALIAVSPPMATHSFAQSTNPSIPVGSLSANPLVVQAGTKPLLNWAITYPSVVEDYVTVGGSSVTPKQNLIADIRILGAGVTTITRYSTGKTTIVYERTAGKMRYNGSSTWTTIFDGRQTDKIVQQQSIIKTINVTKGQTISFGGQYCINGKWSTFFSSGSMNVRTLVNGSAPPANLPVYYALTLEDFIKPYLDASGKVKIGPMDVIVFMELTSTDPSYFGYDIQDLVFLVTFRTS